MSVQNFQIRRIKYTDLAKLLRNIGDCVKLVTDGIWNDRRRSASDGLLHRQIYRETQKIKYLNFARFPQLVLVIHYSEILQPTTLSNYCYGTGLVLLPVDQRFQYCDGMSCFLPGA